MHISGERIADIANVITRAVAEGSVFGCFYLSLLSVALNMITFQILLPREEIHKGTSTYCIGAALKF